MKASDLTSNMLKILELMSDKKQRVAADFSCELKGSRSTIRRSLQRMVIFGLLSERVDSTSTSHQHQYRITNDGLNLLKLSQDQDEVIKQKAIDEVKMKTSVKELATHQAINTLLGKQKSIVSYLRCMAEACTRMADDLSDYE